MIKFLLASAIALAPIAVPASARAPGSRDEKGCYSYVPAADKPDQFHLSYFQMNNEQRDNLIEFLAQRSGPALINGMKEDKDSVDWYWYGTTNGGIYSVVLFVAADPKSRCIVWYWGVGAATNVLFGGNILAGRW